MKRTKIMTALFITLLASSAHLAQARDGFGGGEMPGYGRPEYGHGPGRPGGDRREMMAARQAFDLYVAAQHAAEHLDFSRTVNLLRDAKFEIRGIRNYYLQSARERTTMLAQRLNNLYLRDRRGYWFESRHAIDVIENAKIDLARSGLLGRRL